MENCRRLLIILIGMMFPAFAVAGESLLITHGPRDCPRVALTFDICQTPGRPTTLDRPLIAILRREKIPATFFIGGDWMRTHPEELRELASVPYFELANHSWSHPDLRRENRAQIAFQVGRTSAELIRQTGRASNYFRLPFGFFNDETLDNLSGLQQHVIQWDVVSGDPDPQVSADKMAKSIRQQIHNGSIVVMHANGRGRHTAEALPGIIAFLRERHLQPVTVSALLGSSESKHPELALLPEARTGLPRILGKSLTEARLENLMQPVDASAGSFHLQ